MSYGMHLLIMIGLYLLLAYSLNLVVGYSGLLSLGHAVFFGIGAYTYALLSLGLGPPFLLTVTAAVLVGAVFGGAIAFPALRFRGDMFVLVTLAFQMIAFSILNNWVGLTNGPYGLSGIPRPSLFGYSVRGLPAFLLLVVCANSLLLPILFALYRSPFGLILKALRENERAAASLGVCPRWRYVQAMVLAGGFAAVPGALYASYVTFIDPTSFTLQEGIFLVAILLLGGSGNRIGPLIGVVLMVLLPEGLRFVGFPDTIAPNAREIIYGSLLIFLMYFRPQGIAGEFEVG